MFITKLDVVNGCLSTMGETGLTDLQEDHAYRESALRVLREEQDRVLARGWWFNQENTRLFPDSVSGYIYVPEDVYSVISTNTGYSVTQMGRRMYNARARTYVWECPIPVRLTRKFDFDDLPYPVAAAIRDAAILKFQSTFDGDRDVKEECRRAASLSREELVREDVRNQKYNMLYRPGMSGNALDALTRRDTTYIPGPNIRYPF